MLRRALALTTILIGPYLTGSALIDPSLIGSALIGSALIGSAATADAAPQPSAGGVMQAGGPVPPAIHLSYDAYAAGLNVIKMTASLRLTPASYGVDLDYHTSGLFGAIISSEMHNTVTGTWAANGADPERFYAYGQLRGRPRRTLIDYLNGQPQLRILEPANDDEREPVPPNMQRNTIDTLSAIALLVHEVARTGRCDGHVTTFDGRRVSEITVRDAGQEVLAKDSDSIFNGVTHRCDFEGRQTAGFVRDVDKSELARVQHGTAWLAAIMPGEPALPVRLSFHTRFFGNATMYLTELTRETGTAGQ